MKRLPTDLEILNEIYKQHYLDYVNFNIDRSIRSDKILVPIDISKVAKKLKAEDDIVFGRLYYYLEHKYGYKNEDGSEVNLFALIVGGLNSRLERHCVNFPYMASVLADLRYAHKTSRFNLIAATVSAIGAILSVIFAAVAMTKS